MSFTAPVAFWWALLGIPIIVLYILKIRLRRVPVSTILFWQQIFEEKKPRSIWRRLRHLISLLLQLLFLTFLMLALAKPIFDWEIVDARHVVVIVDNSASMHASDGERERLEQAKEQALRAIDGLRVHDVMALVSGGNQPRVFCGFTNHKRTLREALDAIPGTDGPTRIPAAVALARRLLAQEENKSIVVLSDGCFDEVEELATSEDVSLVRVGAETGNVGITRFQVRRSAADAVGYEVLVEVEAFTKDPVECRLELSLGDQLVDVIPMTLAPGVPWTKSFQNTATDGGHLIARIDRADALMADNEAIGILPRRLPHPVTLVGKQNLFLEMVFRAAPLVELRLAEETAPAPRNDREVTVFHKKAPAKLPAGRVLVIDPSTATDLWDIGDVLTEPLVVSQDKSSPLMQHVQLENVYMPEARRVAPKAPHKVLAGVLSGDPVFIQFDRPEGNVLVLSGNLEAGDLPLRTAFPIMMTNALRWFAGAAGDLRESLPTGSVSEVVLDGALLKAAGFEGTPAEANLDPGTLVLRAPDGAVRPLEVERGRTTIGPLGQRGVWTILAKDTVPAEGAPTIASPADGLEIACNVASPAESDVTASEELEAETEVVASGLGGHPFWWYLVAFAAALTITEWCLYQRRKVS